MIRQLTKDEVHFQLVREPEELPYVGNCSAISDEIDSQQEKWIEEELDSGNEWAWCQVTILASWNGFTGSAQLCGCSYESEEAFKLGGYYDDLLDEALDDLNGEVGRAYEKIKELIS